MSNVRVLVRFRPQNKLELESGGTTCAIFHPDKQTISLKMNNQPFTFDRVYDYDTTQAQMYEETAKPIIEDILQGFNGTIFAYGQTSCGKTFTMEGPDIDDPEKRGIIPRICHDVFNYILRAPETLEFTVKVSYMEIYLEKIKDLLDDTKDNLQVHEDPQKGIYVKNVTEVYVGSVEETMDIMRRGALNRAVAQTRMNAESSRSHSVFQLTISQRDLTNNTSKTGKLYLVDLAGSEKVGKTNAKGLTLDEAKMINKSLSSLGMVINALTDGKSKHIPYRDSKLTRILQESLGGNSRTTIIINCSPSTYNEAETLSSLRFGSRAKNIKNKARVNVQLSVEELTRQLESLKKRLDLQEKELKQWRGGEKPSSGALAPSEPSELESESKLPVSPSKEGEGIAMSDEEREELLKSNNELLDRLAEQESELERLQKENAELRTETESLERLSQEAAALSAQLEEVQQRKEVVMRENSEGAIILESLTSKVEAQKMENDQLKAKVEALQRELASRPEEGTVVDADSLDEARQQLNNAVAERDQLRLQNADLGERVRALTDECNEYLEQMLAYEQKMLQEVGQEDIIRQIKAHVESSMVSKEAHMKEVLELRDENDRLKRQLQEIEQAQLPAREAVQAYRLEQTKKIKFLEKSVEALGKVHQQLLEQNSQLKLEVCIAEKKLAARNERIKSLEQQIFEREQLQTREELDFRFKIARLESTIATLRQQIASTTNAASKKVGMAHIAKPIRGQGVKVMDPNADNAMRSPSTFWLSNSSGR
eukprot:comp20134_c0_seq1/m.24871 comp20134_c0_seq1/g.24871  ORF comp20134_c0_seq1/g.24871 comp20134_c0_seq1/m.24871 type:complete len:771 (-) comp20134_c0_seq1:77-2389(-)